MSVRPLLFLVKPRHPTMGSHLTSARDPVADRERHQHPAPCDSYGKTYTIFVFFGFLSRSHAGNIGWLPVFVNIYSIQIQ